MRNTLKQERLIEKLNSEFGSAILSYLADPCINEIVLNSDSKLWIRHQGQGFLDTGETMSAPTAEQLIGSIADQSYQIINEQYAILETELPLSGYRFTGVLPPIVKAPSFSIRKSCYQRLTLDDYLNEGVITPDHARVLRGAIEADRTFLISGGPGSGKTTFANMLLHEMAERNNNARFIIIEDTRELQCAAPNTEYYKTSYFADYEALLKVTLRSSPDKIILGECRGSEILTLLTAWNTGAKGGLATIHSNSAESALLRITDIAKKSGVIISPSFVSESIDIIIGLNFSRTVGRKVSQILQIHGFKGENYVFKKY